MSIQALRGIYNVLDYAVQRKEGQEGVGQWEDFGVGAGFQVDLEG